MFNTKKQLENEIFRLQDKLDHLVNIKKKYEEENENLKADLEDIRNGNCAPGAYCEHCQYGGKVEHQHLWSTSYDYVCLKDVACKQFDKRVALHSSKEPEA